MENSTTRCWSNLKRIGGNDFVGESEQIEQASRSRERKTDLRQEFEGRAWRTPEEQIMTRSARSSRHGFRKESSIHDGKNKKGERSNRQTMNCLRGFRLFFSSDYVFFSSSVFLREETNQFDSVPESLDLWFEISKVYSDYRTTNTEIHLRCHNWISWN